MTRVKDDDKDEATERRLARLPPGIQALRGTMKTSFAYVTIKDRLPVILTRAIDALARSTDFCPEVPPIPIIALLSKLKYEMERDRVLEPFPSEPQWALWNAALTAIQEDGVDSWFSAPWLYSECAMYGKIHECVMSLPEWQSFDIFRMQKRAAFHDSSKAIRDLTQAWIETRSKTTPKNARQCLETYIPMALWGNQSDLSLFANASEVQQAQSQMAACDEHTVVNDLDAVVDYISTLQNGESIVFVLDNSGFELLTDLILADVLSTHSPTLKIIFHCKEHPWFVSDTMITDFHWTLDALDKIGCKTLTDRWRQWLTTGSWVVKDHPFWTTPLSFWNLKEHGGEAYEDIRTAGLTIYKGDLNYRRMLFDGTWPKTTPFKDAIGPFHSTETKPFLMLRTGKSDVAVGLLPGQEDALKAKDPHWEINGKWGLIQFYPGYDQAV